MESQQAFYPFLKAVMSYPRSLVLPLLGLSLVTPSFAQSTEAELKAMQDQLNQLKSELAELKGRQSASDSARDVDATVAQVMADAEKRSQLLQLQGFTAGWTADRFVLQSEDGNYSLKPSFQLQVRHVLNNHETAGDDSTDHGFEIRRMKFSIDGNLYSRKLTYFVLVNTNSNNGNLFLEHAWVKYMIDDVWGVRAGQIGNPVFKEQALSSKRTLAVDRSLANVVVSDSNEAETQGVTLTQNPGWQ